MTAVAPRTPARVPGKLPTVPARPRHCYSYFVWPSGSHAAYAAYDTLDSALQEAAQARQQGITDVWIVRSDGVEVQGQCTNCGRETEAFRVATHPVLRDYWCPTCWEIQGLRIVNRRLSPLQQRMLHWLWKDAAQAPAGKASNHKALVKALSMDKGNISKSLRNLADKNLVHIRYSSGGQVVSVELTPLGWYKAHVLEKL
jgi:hypothetical protein